MDLKVANTLQALAWKTLGWLWPCMLMQCKLSHMWLLCRRCLLLKFSTMKHDSVLSESRAALLSAAASAPVNRRMAVLMSLHPRCALRPEV